MSRLNDNIPVRVFLWSCLLIFGLVTTLPGQSGYILKVTTGTVHFVSEAPLELIEATTDQIAGLIDTEKNIFAFSLPVNSFDGFNSPLQKEHFNEKYLQTPVYPKAIFAGKMIEKFKYDTDGVYEVRAKGTLEIHGVEQERIIKSQLIVKGGQITLKSAFTVQLMDHDIKIPRIVSQKISEVIRVDLVASLIRS